MKGIRQLLVIAVIALAGACSSPRNSSSTPQDDVYYSKSDAPQSPPPAVSHPSPSNRSSDNSSSNQSQDNQSQDYSSNSSSGNSSSQEYKDQSGNTTINNYYNSDDYYDYSYSSRIRRYYSPVAGYGYYDPFYTNMYWYDYNPHSYGVSIYLGYHFWAPPVYYYSPFCYGPSITIGYGWGYSPFYSPFYSPYYNPWHSPYYGGYGYYGNPYGYNNPYYYNSFDGTTASSSHYGPRGSVSGTGRSVSPPPRTIGEKYQVALAENRVSNVNDGSLRNSSPSIPVRKTPETNSINEQVQQTPTDRGDGSIGGTNVTGGSVRNSAAKSVNGLADEPTPVKPGTERGIISDKNGNGGTRIKPDVQPLSGGQYPQREDHGPSKGNVIEPMPNNNGGIVRPKVDRQTMSDQVQPENSQLGNSPSTTPRNNDLRRNQNTTPNLNLPNQERSYDRPRQYQQAEPRVEPRSEPRQYKQPENSQPRQQPSYSAPRQQPSHSSPAPERRSSPAPSENRGSGRRK